MNNKECNFTDNQLCALFTKYNKFKKSTDKRYSLSNEILYKLCQEHIKHEKKEEIEAKLLLIGRTYAASVERRKTKETKQYNNGDFIYDHIMKIFINDNGITRLAKELDSKITELNANFDFNIDNVDKLLKIHKKLIDATFKYTKNEKRSLCSKYLHFHCPKAAYIYDSRAKAVITKFVHKQKYIIFQDDTKLILEDSYDNEYFDFLARIAILKKRIKQWMPRQVDDFLLWYADNVLKLKRENI